MRVPHQAGKWPANVLGHTNRAPAPDQGHDFVPGHVSARIQFLSGDDFWEALSLTRVLVHVGVCRSLLGARRHLSSSPTIAGRSSWHKARTPSGPCDGPMASDEPEKTRRFNQQRRLVNAMAQEQERRLAQLGPYFGPVVRGEPEGRLSIVSVSRSMQ